MDQQTSFAIGTRHQKYGYQPPLGFCGGRKVATGQARVRELQPNNQAETEPKRVKSLGECNDGIDIGRSRQN